MRQRHTVLETSGRKQNNMGYSLRQNMSPLRSERMQTQKRLVFFPQHNCNTARYYYYLLVVKVCGQGVGWPVDNDVELT